MSNQQIAELIFEAVFKDILLPNEESQITKLFRHMQVQKIREVLEKCQQN